MENLSSLSNEPGISDLENALKQKQDLETAIANEEFVSSDVRDAYVQTHLRVTENVNSILSDDTVLGELSRIHDEASTSLDQIQQLKLITGEENSLEREFQERVNTLAPLIGKRSLVPSDHIEEEPLVKSIEPEGITAPEEREVLKNSVQLVVSEKIVSIGKNGKKVSFAPTGGNPENNKIYKEARRVALTYVVDNQDRLIRPDEIISAIESKVAVPDDLKHDALRSIRTFFEQLTFRRAPIIQHNGVRGLGSRYYTSENFDVAIKTRESNKTDVSLQNATLSHEPSQNVTNEDIITTQELALVATRLSRIDDALTDYGFPSLDDEIKDRLYELAKQYAQPEQMQNDAIEDRREQAGIKMQQLINDEKKFEEYIDLTDEASPQYMFVEYFMDLESADDKNLMQRLISAEIRNSYTTERFGQVKPGQYYLTDRETGEVLWPLLTSLEDYPTTGSRTRAGDDDFEKSIPTQEEGADDFEITVKDQCDSIEVVMDPELCEDAIILQDRNQPGAPEDNGPVYPTYVDDNGEKRQERRNPRKLESRLIFDEIKTGLETTLETLVGNDKIKITKTTVFSYPKLIATELVSPKMVSEALASKQVLSGSEHNVRDRTYSIEEFLRIKAFQLSKGTKFSIAERKPGKHVLRLIDEMIEGLPA